MKFISHLDWQEHVSKGHTTQVGSWVVIVVGKDGNFSIGIDASILLSHTVLFVDSLPLLCS